MLRYLTIGPKVRLLQAVQKVIGAAQRYDKKTEDSYRPLLALSHRVTEPFYAWCAAVWKANDSSSLCDSHNFTKQ